MEIRLSDSMINESLLQAMLSNQSSLTKLSTEISSDSAVNVASDDPLSALTILQSNTALDQNTMYTSAVSSAKSELTTTDSSLSDLVTIITKAQSLATQASNGTNSTLSLTAISDEITQLLGEVTDVANTKVGSKYIFGGTVTNTAPYSTDSSGNITYNGTASTDNYQRTVNIGDGVSVTMNLAGDSIFGQSYKDASGTLHQSGIIGDLSSLYSKLTAATPDYSAISSSIGSLTTDLNTVESAQSTIGGVENRLTMASSTLSSSKTNLTTIKSNAQDADLTTLISKYESVSTAYNASLKVSASINNISLLNYM